MQVKKSAGFGVVEVILILVLVGIIVFLGWRMYQYNKDESQETQTSQQSPDESEVGADDSILDPTDFIDAYNLPEGWTDKECKPGIIAVIPKDTSDPDCSPNQPATIVTIYLQDNFEFIDPTDCEVTEKKIDKSYAAFESFSCQEVTVNETKGIRTTKAENEKSIAGQNNTTISYIFPADGKLLTVSYFNIESENHPERLLSEFDSFAKSFKFQ